MNQLELDPQPAEQFYRIPLTQGQFAIVDEIDYGRLTSYKWFAMWDDHSQSFYAGRHSPTVNGYRTIIRMHREIMKVSARSQVDHASHDTLDNRRSNLRLATHGQNKCNQGKRKDNTSGFKGVSWRKRERKWIARIALEGKRKVIGYYDSAEDAGAAYKAAAIELHGAFAKW